ncbi:archaeoflavoprotein, MJ0208 family [Methanothermus fervidus DSM 2088]|uniref:Archaeoflavoprotein, MJ0208 family n=1 Tax=Methanothermus fervidus (strain ATCC 43054 / DSM 2088 / JCM 10308 / V24 S) TaxID=523846 RepID=E3GZ70_METFV|nr:dihydromethanopterin reductase (acceptor) [Methanothermus fervidus]ADP77602.1 archaeoflavoprotein, MJ0208 family [Methanothermus fervidus DSM 2088]
MRVAWAFTGAGHFLKESVMIYEKVAKKHDVTVLMSKAGEEVLKMYGLYDRVKKFTGGYYKELVREKDQEYSFPITGRFSLGRYDLLIVSPATANTVAKIVHGIADTLVTNAVAQAGKGRVKTLIVPVDIKVGKNETVLPSKLELDLCKNCETCKAAAACPTDAIIPGREIELLKCIGCGSCEKACPYNAIVGGKIIEIYVRKIDVENTKLLNKLECVEVIDNPKKILDYITSFS